MLQGRVNASSFSRISGVDVRSQATANLANFDIDLSALPIAANDFAFVVIQCVEAGVGSVLAVVGRDNNNGYSVATLLSVTAVYLALSITGGSSLRITNGTGGLRTIRAQFLRVGFT